MFRALTFLLGIPKLAVTLVLSVLLSACFPVFLGSYYKPLVQQVDVRYTGNECHGYSGAPVAVTLPLPAGVALTISTRIGSSDKDAEELSVAVRAMVPKGVDIQFADEAVAVAADGARTVSYRPQWRVSGTRSLGASRVVWSELTAVPELLGSGMPTPPDFSGRISAYFTWPGFHPQAIDLTLPGYTWMATGAMPVAIPPLRVALQARQLQPDETANRSSTIYYRTAELASQFEQTRSQCLREGMKPKMPFNCAEMADMRNTEFQLEQGPLAVVGRFWVHDPLTQDTTRGRLSYHFNTPNDIAWKDNAFVFVGTGPSSPADVRTFAVDGMSVYASMLAPLTAKIVGINEPSPSDATTASFVLQLGREQKSIYRLLLPPLKINGKPVPLEPVVLELRRFEMGTSPFNC